MGICVSERDPELVRTKEESGTCSAIHDDGSTCVGMVSRCWNRSDLVYRGSLAIARRQPVASMSLTVLAHQSEC